MKKLVLALLLLTSCTLGGRERIDLNPSDVLFIQLSVYDTYDAIQLRDVNYVDIDSRWFHIVGDNAEELNVKINVDHIVFWGIDR